MTKTAKKITPGLARLRAAKNAETIRSEVLADQKRARRQARARIPAPTAAQAARRPRPRLSPCAGRPEGRHGPHGAPHAAIRARSRHRPHADPDARPTMPGMSKATAEAYMAAARGVMPTPPNFSAASYKPDRPRLAKLIEMAEAGDAKALRGYSIKVYYSAALALDRYRQMAVIALEARAAA
jgi:hypothetical protein